MPLETTIDPLICTPLLFIGFITAILFSIGILKHNKFTFCLMEAARSLGLKYHDAGFFYAPKLSGEYREKYIHIYSFTKHLSDMSKRYTRIEAAHDGQISSLISVTAGHLPSDMASSIGLHDVHHLEKKFDNLYNVRGGSSKEVNTLFDGDLRKMIVERNIDFDISGSHVIHEVEGYITDKKHMLDVLDFLIDVAERIDELKKK
ncbi:hypothetical protein ACFLRF_03705 [Candidatus Altiarchaeota archaeon]